MIKSVRGLSLRFFKMNKFTAISLGVSVMLSVCSNCYDDFVFSSHSRSTL